MHIKLYWNEDRDVTLVKFYWDFDKVYDEYEDMKNAFIRHWKIKDSFMTQLILQQDTLALSADLDLLNKERFHRY